MICSVKNTHAVPTLGIFRMYHFVRPVQSPIGTALTFGYFLRFVSPGICIRVDGL